MSYSNQIHNLMSLMCAAIAVWPVASFALCHYRTAKRIVGRGVKEGLVR